VYKNGRRGRTLIFCHHLKFFIFQRMNNFEGAEYISSGWEILGFLFEKIFVN
jgi:hypothetical protein